MINKEDFPDQDIMVEVEGTGYVFNLREVAERLVIDPVHLETELEQQANFYLWVAIGASTAASDAEDSKHGFEIFVAELEKEVRRDFDRSELKATEAKVAAAVKTHPEYLSRLEAYLSDKRIADIMSVVKEATRMRQFLLIERSRRAYKDDAAASED